MNTYEVPYTFLYITLKGLAVGMLFGIITGLVTKYYRSLTRSPIQETFFMMMMAIQSYYVGEVLKASGVTSLIACAVMQAQYSWYNLSPQGKHASGITVATLGFLAEAYVFCIIGLGMMNLAATNWAPWFIIACFIILFIQRMASVLIC